MNVPKGALLVVILALLAIAISTLHIYEHYQTSRSGSNPFPEVPALSSQGKALFDAVSAGDAEAIRQLVSNDPSLLSVRLPNGATPLHVAAGRNTPAIVELLLDQGADIEARGQWGGTPLHWAAWLGASNSVSTLLARGAVVEARCEAFGSTPLLWAAHGSTHVRNPQGDYVAVTRVLIDAGAAAETFNRWGQSAASMADETVGTFLREHGASAPKPTTQPADSNGQMIFAPAPRSAGTATRRHPPCYSDKVEVSNGTRYRL